jgi:ferredoxin-fold anticodon binding domain-containing protein
MTAKEFREKFAKQQNTKRSKFGNIKIQSDENTFDSKKEFERYRYLLLLEKSGDISNLRFRKADCRRDLIVNGVVIGTYTPDFIYGYNGEEIWEDVKSTATARTKDFRRTCKHVKAQYGITVLVV